MRFFVMTLFPDMIRAGLGESIVGRAVSSGRIEINVYNIRDYSADKHGSVDDYPYGGGAGMVMQAQPVYDCYRAIRDVAGEAAKVVYLTPQGRIFSQSMAKSLSKGEDLILLCGHYEGIDERVLEEIVDMEISIGDYVLTGGELPAMVLADAVVRLIPGVLHNEDSPSTESFENGLLEYPQYSRPEVWRERQVPPILLSGDHGAVDRWRAEKAAERTMQKRPDMWAAYEESHKE